VAPKGELGRVSNAGRVPTGFWLTGSGSASTLGPARVGETRAKHRIGGWDTGRPYTLPLGGAIFLGRGSSRGRDRSSRPQTSRRCMNPKRDGGLARGKPSSPWSETPKAALESLRKQQLAGNAMGGGPRKLGPSRRKRNPWRGRSPREQRVTPRPKNSGGHNGLRRGARP
jgi:hypothetical protein